MLSRVVLIVACGASLSLPAHGQSTSDGIFTTSIDPSVVHITQCDVSRVGAGTNGNYRYLHYNGDINIVIAADVDSADIVIFGSRYNDPLHHPSVAYIETMKHHLADRIPQWARVDFKNQLRYPVVFRGKKRHAEDYSLVSFFGCGVLRVVMRNGDTQTDPALAALYHKTY